MVLTKRPQRMYEWLDGAMPRSNIWIGVSVENQVELEKRLPYLINTPAAVRFVSFEPLLGRVSLQQHDYGSLIHWIIAGGESGPAARRMDPGWVWSLREQCRIAEVPFFFKQWGDYKPVVSEIWSFWNAGYDANEKKGGRVLYGHKLDEYPI